MHPADRFQPVPAAFLDDGRVRLRTWTDADRAPFAALNADPRVMAHFPAPLTHEQSDALLAEIRARMGAWGWGFWALEVLEDAGAAPAFAGMVGLNIPRADLPFSPCVEIGWRLSPPFWGQDLATRAARLTLRAGFETLGLHEIVAFTTLGNQRSRALMVRLGMVESPADAFDHPALAADSPLRPHCLYRLPRARWAAAGSN